MRKNFMLHLAVLIGLALILGGSQCPTIPGTEDVTVTIVTEEFIELLFEARGSLNVDSGEEMIDIDELREELEDAGVDISTIDTIRVAQVLYGVTAYNEGPTDRRIVDGYVDIRRLPSGPSATLVSDLDVDVYPLLGELVPAPIEPGGIDFVNDLLLDILDALKNDTGGQFFVQGSAGGVSEPTGRETNFDWRVRIYFHIPGLATVEVPDF
ncbi:MAG: hypothetical protein GF355_14930 [Candidatus Eisenbacteria bacterium]|nr:hypothetical protein [Candidatus Eisenbacteria bacterium]